MPLDPTISPYPRHTFHSPSRRRFPPFLNLLQNDPFQTLRLRRTCPPPPHRTIPPHQKLLKIPLHPLQSKKPRCLLLQVLKHRLRVLAVDFCLPQNGERNAVVDEAEILDGVVVAGVLLHELVAGETEDDEGVWVGGGDFLVERFETGVLGREAAF